jgi:hypothetical protein
MFTHVHSFLYLMVLYWLFQAAVLVLLILRILSLVSFQKRMAIITKVGLLVENNMQKVLVPVVGL